MLINTILKIMASVIVISAFIGVFFFTYEAKVEADIVKNQSTEIIMDFTENLRTLLPTGVLKDLYIATESSLVPPNLSTEDEEVETSNSQLMKKATNLIIKFVVIGVSLCTLLFFVFKINPKEILLSTTIMLIFVAIAEYVFVTYIVKNYRTIDSNFVKSKILSILANYK